MVKPRKRRRRSKRPKGVHYLIKDMPEHVHHQFKAYCLLRGLSMRTRILQLIKIDMAKQKAGDIVALIRDYNNDVLRPADQARN